MSSSPVATTGQVAGAVEERVTDHAALRWLQRVDAREPRPAERVREALARARRAAMLDPRGERDPRTDAVLVVRGGVVRTVLLAGQRSDGRNVGP